MDTTLFILVAQFDIDYSESVGVYSSREAAEAEIARLETYGYGHAPLGSSAEYEIVEKVLDAPAKKEF
jgi:hypothetical protein